MLTTLSRTNLSQRQLDRLTLEISAIDNALEATEILLKKTTGIIALQYQKEQSEKLLNRIKGFRYQWASKNPSILLAYPAEYIRGALESKDVNKDSSTFIEEISRKFEEISYQVGNKTTLSDIPAPQAFKEAAILGTLERTDKLISSKKYDLALANLRLLHIKEEDPKVRDKLKSKIVAIENELFEKYEPSQEILDLLSKVLKCTFIDQESFIITFGTSWELDSFNHKMNFARHFVNALCKNFDKKMVAPLICTADSIGNAAMDVAIHDYKTQTPSVITVSKEKCEDLTFEDFMTALTHEAIHVLTAKIIRDHKNTFANDEKWISYSLASLKDQRLYFEYPFEKISWAFHDFIKNSCNILQYQGVCGLRDLENPRTIPAAHPSNTRKLKSFMQKKAPIPTKFT